MEKGLYHIPKNSWTLCGKQREVNESFILSMRVKISEICFRMISVATVSRMVLEGNRDEGSVNQ